MDFLIHLDKQLLLALNGSDCLWLDNLMWYVSRTPSWSLMMIALLWLVMRRNNWRATAAFILCFVQCIVLAYQISSTFIKPWVMRPRPTHDPEIGALVDIVRNHRGGKYGFVSSHAANTFAVVTMMSLVIRRRALTFVTVTWAMLVCYSRMYLGVHYPGDIFFGGLLGVLVGWLMYRLYLFLAGPLTINVEPRDRLTATGFSVFRLRCFIASVFLSYLFLIVRSFF